MASAATPTAKTHSQSPLDRDQQQGLVRWLILPIHPRFHLGRITARPLTSTPTLQEAIRDFLKVRTSYDVLPLSFRLIILDTDLLIKKSLNILIQNCAPTTLPTQCRTPADLLPC